MSDTIIPLHTTNNKTLQFFLNVKPLLVCEVGAVPLDDDGHYQLRCTCPDWSPDLEADPCVHTTYVAARILAHPRNYYPTRIIGGLHGTGLNGAMRHPDVMRHWLTHYAEIVAL